MRQRKIVDFTYGRKLINMQLNIRLRCMALIKRNRGGGTGNMNG